MREERDFWSRRRAAVAEEAKAESVARRQESDARAQARMDQLPDAEVLEALDLPEPESLKAGDDFSAFMKQAVPERLRRRALRALWRTNPLLANVDGLVDYGGDFTDKATVIENLQTAYQVGKGMMAHLERMSAPASVEPGEEPEAEPDDPAAAEDTPDVAPATALAETEAKDEMEVALAPRRMVFAFEDDAR